MMPDMTQVPAGWYPDPAPQQAGLPPQSRYWDGTRWTEHTHVPVQQGYPQAPAYPQTQAPMYGAPAKATTTPDGQPLASWWARAGASVIDYFVILPVWLVLASPFYPHLVHEFRIYFDQVQTAVDNGTTQPSAFTFEGHIIGTLVAIAAIQFVVLAVYSIGFLKWKQATVGKLALGLRVRLREAPGPLSWGTVLRHWVGQYAVSALGLVPFIGSIAGLYTLIDSLWPLWDKNRQALHDKLARTNVVVHRR
jgi:uncharacterized RDD family membrane protein YckC